jgi:hypothetical protein
MNPKLHKWKRIERNSKSFILQVCDPILGYWLGYWLEVFGGAFGASMIIFCAGAFLSIPFLMVFHDENVRSLIAMLIFGAGFLAFLIAYVFNAKNIPDFTLELRFLRDQEKIELCGRSAFGWRVTRQFKLGKLVKITGFSYKYEAGNSYYFGKEMQTNSGICIVLDAKTKFVLEGLSSKELEYHMAFFLGALPFHTSKELQTTPDIT